MIRFFEILDQHERQPFVGDAEVSEAQRPR